MHRLGVSLTHALPEGLERPTDWSALATSRPQRHGERAQTLSLMRAAA